MVKSRRERGQQTEKDGESLSNLNRQQNCVLCYPQVELKAFLSLPTFINLIQALVPELWVPEDVCVLVMGRGGIGNYPHFPIFWLCGCRCSL